MTDIPIPAGPTNKELIDLAFLSLAMSDAFFGRTDEEYATGVTLLRGMMTEWPFDQLGYDFTSPRPSERSGIEQKWTQVVGLCLGERISAATGKDMRTSAMASKARSYGMLCAAVGNKSIVSYGVNTPAGAGQKWTTFFGEPELEVEQVVTEIVSFDIDALPPAP